MLDEVQAHLVNFANKSFFESSHAGVGDGLGGVLCGREMLFFHSVFPILSVAQLLAGQQPAGECTGSLSCFGMFQYGRQSAVFGVLVWALCSMSLSLLVNSTF